MQKLVEAAAPFDVVREQLAPRGPLQLNDEARREKTIKLLARRPELALSKATNYSSTVFYNLTPNVTAFLFFDEEGTLKDFELGVQ
ncbi:MAG: hypothetical protein ACK4UN_14850 [Limisphaerales bacterium]